MEEPKAKVTISVEYLGEVYEEEGEINVSSGFWDALGDVVAGIDYDIREAREKRQGIKAALRGEDERVNDPYPWKAGQITFK